MKTKKRFPRTTSRHNFPELDLLVGIRFDGGCVKVYHLPTGRDLVQINVYAQKLVGRGCGKNATTARLIREANLLATYINQYCNLTIAVERFVAKCPVWTPAGFTLS